MCGRFLLYVVCSLGVLVIVFRWLMMFYVWLSGFVVCLIVLMMVVYVDGVLFVFVVLMVWLVVLSSVLSVGVMCFGWILLKWGRLEKLRSGLVLVLVDIRFFVCCWMNWDEKGNGGGV